MRSSFEGGARGLLVRALGPLEVAGADGWQRVAAAKPRALLAILVAGRGRPVSVDRLVDELWDDAAPRSAINLIQQYVRQIRQLLGDPAGERLRTRAPGYELPLGENELDVAHFECLVERASGLIERGDRAVAADVLVDALDLWRGEPFADVPKSSRLAAEAERLEQLRLTATESRIAADLELGRHATAVPELTELTAEHAVRERLWELLMLALYRSGRQADALEAYRRLYAILDTELGVEPARGVRDLHQRILVADPGLDPPPAAPAAVPGPSLPVPRQLPPDVSGFVGRVDALARLDALVPDGPASGGPVIATVTGMGGVGKTALAVHWGHRVADRFPDGQLYVNLRGFDEAGQRQPEAVLHSFIEALGVAPERIPADIDAQAGLYRSLLAERRILVLLDNARDVEHARPLLPAGPGCMAVVTSRDRLTGLVAAAGAHPTPVDLLTDTESRQLLVNRIGADRVDAEPGAVAALVEACGGLPLALGIVGAHAASGAARLGELAADLRDSATGLDAFSGGDAGSDVRAVFSWSYRQLSPTAARVFRLLGLHPGPDISTPAITSLAALTARETRAALAELQRHHLIGSHQSSRYVCHDLVRAYATELVDADSDADRHEAMRRVLDHYLQTAFLAVRHINPYKVLEEPAYREDREPSEEVASFEEAMDWFATEHLVLLAVIEQANRWRFDRHTWQLASAARDFLQRRGHWRDQIASQEIAVEAARRAGDRAAEATVYRGGATAYCRLGRHDEAIDQLRTALDLCEEVGDDSGLELTHSALAQALAEAGRPTEALGHAQRALELHRAAGHEYWAGDALNQIGWLHAQLGDYHSAIRHCEESLRLTQQHDNQLGQASAWDSLGYAHHQLGNFRQALACYQSSLRMLAAVGDRYNEAEVLEHIGDTQHAAGDIAAARAAWKEAHDILDDINHPAAEPVLAKLTKDDPAQG